MAGDECARAGLLGPSTGVPGEGGVERERERGGGGSGGTPRCTQQFDGVAFAFSSHFALGMDGVVPIGCVPL